MGAGYLLGAEPKPIMTFCARVSGPLALARAEAAGPIQRVTSETDREYA